MDKAIAHDFARMAERLQDESTRLVDLGDGYIFKIQAIGSLEILAVGQKTPTVMPAKPNKMSDVRNRLPKDEDDDDDSITINSDAATYSKMINEALKQGLLAPRLWTGKTEERPSGWVTLSNIYRFRMKLWDEIMDLSGLTAEVSSASSFPDTEREGSGDGGSSEGELSVDLRDADPTAGNEGG